MSEALKLLLLILLPLAWGGVTDYLFTKLRRWRRARRQARAEAG